MCPTARKGRPCRCRFPWRKRGMPSALYWRKTQPGTTGYVTASPSPPILRRPASIELFTCCWRSWRQDIRSECLVFFFAKENVMDFRPLNDTERRQLITALRGNAESDRAILMDRRDTSFLGSVEEVPDEEVISAIRSVPCHY